MERINTPKIVVMSTSPMHSAASQTMTTLWIQESDAAE
jgi:hypothetical protein